MTLFFLHNVFARVLAIAMVAAVPLLVFPSVIDSFELPKRLVWLAAVLLPLSARHLEGKWNPLAIGAVSLSLLWIALRTGFAGFAPKTLSPMAVWLLPGLLFLCGFLFRPGEKALRAIGCTLFLSGAFQAAVMLLQRFGMDPFFTATTSAIDYLPGRMIGTVGYQNQAAEFVGLCLFCVLLCRKGTARSTPFPLIRAILAALMFAAILLSANRGALLACVAACFWLGGRCLPKRRVAIVFGLSAVAVLGFAFCVPELRGRIAELAVPLHSKGLLSRVLMWKSALSLWSDHLFFGSGAGGYAYEYIDRLGVVFPEEQAKFYLNCVVYAREAHCDFLQYLAEFGLVGMVLLVAGGVAVVKCLDGRKEDVTAFGGVMSFVVVCSLFNFTFQTAVTGPLAGFVLGLLAGKGTARDAPCGAAAESYATAGKWTARPAPWRAVLRPCTTARDAPSPLGRAVAGECATARDAPSPLAPFTLRFAVVTGLVVCGVIFCRENSWNLRIARMVETGDAGAIEQLVRAKAPKGRWLALCGSSIAAANGNLAVAEQAFSESLNDYVSPEVLNNYANALVRQGKFDEACALYKRLAKSGILRRESLHSLAVVRYVQRDWVNSYPYWHEFWKRYSAEMTDDDWYRYVSCMLQVGATEKALRKLKWIEGRFAQRRPSPWNASWENLYGAAFLATGEREAAKIRFEKALKLDPHNANAARNLKALGD